MIEELRKLEAKWRGEHASLERLRDSARHAEEDSSLADRSEALEDCAAELAALLAQYESPTATEADVALVAQAVFAAAKKHWNSQGPGYSWSGGKPDPEHYVMARAALQAMGYDISEEKSAD